MGPRGVRRPGDVASAALLIALFSLTVVTGGVLLTVTDDLIVAAGGFARGLRLQPSSIPAIPADAPFTVDAEEVPASPDSADSPGPAVDAPEPPATESTVAADRQADDGNLPEAAQVYRTSLPVVLNRGAPDE